MDLLRLGLERGESALAALKAGEGKDRLKARKMVVERSKMVVQSPSLVAYKPSLLYEPLYNHHYEP